MFMPFYWMLKRFYLIFFEDFLLNWVGILSFIIDLNFVQFCNFRNCLRKRSKHSFELLWISEIPSRLTPSWGGKMGQHYGSNFVWKTFQFLLGLWLIGSQLDWCHHSSFPPSGGVLDLRMTFGPWLRMQSFPTGGLSGKFEGRAIGARWPKE